MGCCNGQNSVEGAVKMPFYLNHCVRRAGQGKIMREHGADISLAYQSINWRNASLFRLGNPSIQALEEFQKID